MFYLEQIIYFQIKRIEIYFESETNPEDPKKNLAYIGYPNTSTRNMQMKIELGLQRS